MTRLRTFVVTVAIIVGGFSALITTAVPSVAEGKLPFDSKIDPTTLPQTALIETSKGAIEIEFFRNEAPITVRNFEYLGKKRFYENLTFHRIVADFIVQGGDPKGNGKGGTGYLLPPEFTDIKHVRGTIGMARKANAVNPGRESNGSQFYICLRRAPHLDGLYTVFARVIGGMGVVDKLEANDKILSVKFPRGTK